MKKIFTFLSVFFLAFTVMAQAPKEINYQGVARNAQGQALANQVIKVKVSLIKDDAVDINAGNASTFYTETRTVTTNALGLFSFKINDDGSAIKTGNFDDGDWLSAGVAHDQYLKIELDVNNSGTWTDMGTQKLVSVPYALYATTALRAGDLSTPLTAFSASSNIGQTVAVNQIEKINFEAVESGSNGFSTATHSFTAGASGLHQFNGVVWASPTAVNPAQAFVYIALYVNGNLRTKFRYQIAAGASGMTCPFAVNLRLNKNDVVSLYFENRLGVSVDVGGSTSVPYTFFSGNNLR